MEQESEEEVLSRRNQKRFKKLASKFSEKIENLEQENSLLLSKVGELKGELELNKSPEVLERKRIISDYDRAYEQYLEAQIESKETEKQLNQYSSSTSTYGKEIVWFSVVIGLIFDFLLWKDIFAGKFGTDSWAERAERASAIILSFSYAFVCAQLGSSYAVQMLVKKRSQSGNEKEIEVYNKSTAKDTIGINVFLFTLLSLVSTLARFTEDHLSFSDKVILSMAATSIGLVISAIAYWYTDVYDHFITAAKNKELKARRNFYAIEKKIKGKKYDS